MNNDFKEYTINYIANRMNLRKPQRKSLEILDDITSNIRFKKDMDLPSVKDYIHGKYPIFQDFEHDFLSLTFALATGVGKTKLMGVFITYLYTHYGIRNFFVVAPNITIYDKLKNDLGNPSPDNEKYVFKGISCFSVERPNIWADDDYKNRPIHAIGDSNSINIFIFNISKFNSDERNIMHPNEYIGDSLFNYLKGLDDLVMIMDESHHYRAKSSAKAINELRPLIGLELTATPQVQKGDKAILFKNVVYEYPLSQAIKDGYTRTPYALTRKDLKAYNLNEEQLDKTKLNDGIDHHENIKKHLELYAHNNHVRLVKPFMLVVCKDTEHATSVYNYIISDAFKNGAYKNKALLIHSNQKESEKEQNTKLLLDVEKTDNPIEIVVHVNILKEGWDVNNLYTIVPLRTATSKTLREQTVGRGLRLPYGKRTGDKLVDSVTITAHDNFEEIIKEAQNGNSIFKADGIIYADYQSKIETKVVQPTLFDVDEDKKEAREIGLNPDDEETFKTYKHIQQVLANNTIEIKKKNIGEKVDKAKVIEETKKDLGTAFFENTDTKHIFDAFICSEAADKTIDNAQVRNMYIPKIKTEKFGNEIYRIAPFDLDMTNLIYAPISNDILMRNLLNSQDVSVVKSSVIDITTVKPEIEIVSSLRNISEIDYEKCPELIQKVVGQFLSYYRSHFDEQQVRNICLMYKKDITKKIGEQILSHLTVTYDDIFETVESVETVVSGYLLEYVASQLRDIHQITKVGESIKSFAYEHSKKSLTTPVKFDSEPERKLAVVCDDNSPEVIQWLRPNINQFNITYNRGRRYQPDFVIETKDKYYLTEVKGENMLNDPIVIAKKERAIKYCELASHFNIARDHKPFEYLFIPAGEISENSSFDNLRKRFVAKQGS